MISIIIPVYNQAGKLDKCLKSILRQDFNDYEIIIVNDGSTDDIKATLSKYESAFGPGLKVINQKNFGANAARNAGWRLATGEFLLFCDADVVMEPNMLQIMYNLLAYNASASYVYSSFFYGKKKFRLFPFDAQKLKKMPYIHTTSLIKHKDFPQSGWDEKLSRLQDWDVWLTMSEQGHTGIWIDKPLFKVKSGGTMSKWLPSFAYEFMPFLPKVKAYKNAVALIKKKHNIS